MAVTVEEAAADLARLPQLLEVAVAEHAAPTNTEFSSVPTPQSDTRAQRSMTGRITSMARSVLQVVLGTRAAWSAKRVARTPGTCPVQASYGPAIDVSYGLDDGQSVGAAQRYRE